MTTIKASWRARWKAIAKYYRALYFAPVTADCPQAGQRAQVTNFCANCEATERRMAELQAERNAAQADSAALRQLLLSLEWNAPMGNCPDCGGRGPDSGHFTWCRLAPVLAAPNPGESLLAELADLQSFAALQTAASDRAIKLWQAAHPDRSDVWPDQAKLLVWLLEQLDATRAERDGLEARLRTANQVVRWTNDQQDGMAEW